MIPGDHIDQRLVAQGGEPPYSWEARSIPDGLACRRWGSIYGVVPESHASERNVALRIRDSAGNQFQNEVPLEIGQPPQAPDGFRLVAGGRLLIGYHPSPLRDGWLNHLSQERGFPINAQLARHTWPAGQAHLNGFFIQQYEVTNQEYEAFVQATGHTVPIAWQPAGRAPEPLFRHPVVNVSYEDARAYCKWRTEAARNSGLPWVYRLPTHWEWEKATRGTVQDNTDPQESDGLARQYPWGDRYGPTWLNAWSDGTCDVDEHDGFQSVAGVCDQAGNVAEWIDGGVVKDGQAWKHVRGASWRKRGEIFGLTYFHGTELVDPRVAQDDIGFRCVVEIPFDRPPEQALVPLGGDKEGFIDGRGQRGQFVGPYQMARFAVSNQEYAEFKENHRFDGLEEWRPVTGVSCQDSVDFCLWKGRREGRPYYLPTRIQWERAYRGARGRIYPWGDTYDRYRCNSMESGWGRTVDVWALWEGVTPEGIYNLCGNTSEWLSERVAVGGSWVCTCEGFGAPPYDPDSETGEPESGIGFRYVTH